MENRDIRWLCKEHILHKSIDLTLIGGLVYFYLNQIPGLIALAHMKEIRQNNRIVLCHVSLINDFRGKESIPFIHSFYHEGHLLLFVPFSPVFSTVGVQGF